MENFNETLSKMAEFLKSEAKTETIIGQQFQLGEFTCVPVMSIGLGLAGMTGEGKSTSKVMMDGEGKGIGSGAGVGLAPVGFLITKGSEIQFIPARTAAGLGSVIEKIPDLLQKYLDKNKKTTEKQGA